MPCGADLVQLRARCPTRPTDPHSSVAMGANGVPMVSLPTHADGVALLAVRLDEL